MKRFFLEIKSWLGGKEACSWIYGENWYEITNRCFIGFETKKEAEDVGDKFNGEFFSYEIFEVDVKPDRLIKYADMTITS